MITAVQILDIFEVYVAGRKFRNDYVEMFKNPSKSELLEITEKSFKNHHNRSIRFAVNPETKTIFVCDGYTGLHPDMRSLAGYTEDDVFIIYGLADYDGSQFVVSLDNCYSEIFHLFNIPKYRNLADTFLNFDWSWVSSYVRGLESYINKLRVLVK